MGAPRAAKWDLYWAGRMDSSTVAQTVAPRVADWVFQRAGRKAQHWVEMRVVQRALS